MDENMNVEELANGFVNAFSDMATVSYTHLTLPTTSRV